MIAKGIRATCPECYQDLEPQGNIAHDRHAYGSKGKVSCPDCGWAGTVSIDVCLNTDHAGEA